MDATPAAAADRWLFRVEDNKVSKTFMHGQCNSHASWGWKSPSADENQGLGPEEPRCGSD